MACKPDPEQGCLKKGGHGFPCPKVYIIKGVNYLSLLYPPYVSRMLQRYEKSITISLRHIFEYIDRKKKNANNSDNRSDGNDRFEGRVSQC